MVFANRTVEDFFREYRVAVHQNEFERYAAFKNGAGIDNDFSVIELTMKTWKEIVTTIYNRNIIANAFLISGAKGHSSSRKKRLGIPIYSDKVQFFYPRRSEEFLWARFLFLVFAVPERPRLWSDAGSALALCAPVFVLEKLYRAGGKAKLGDLAVMLGYTPKPNSNSPRNIFDQSIKHMLGKFLEGPASYGVNNIYYLTDFSKKICKLAFSKSFQRKYYELERNRIFALALRSH